MGKPQARITNKTGETDWTVAEEQVQDAPAPDTSDEILDLEAQDEALATPPEEPAATPATSEAKVPETKTAERDEKGRFVAKPRLSPASLHMAQQIGMTQEQAEASSPEEIRSLFDHWSRNSVRQDPANPPAAEEDEYEQFVPEVAAVLRKKDARLKALEEKSAAIERNWHNSQKNAQWDKHFADPELESIFGKGSLNELTPGSDEFNARMEIAASVEGDPQKGAKVLKSIKAALARGQKAKPAAAAAPSYTNPVVANPTNEQWNNGALAKATQRNGAKEPKGVEAAKRKFLEKSREFGLTDDDYEFPE